MSQTERFEGPEHQTQGPRQRFGDRLIEACINGEPGAWEEFVDHYGRFVWVIPSRLGLGRDGCEDVFQSVLAIAFRSLPNIRDPSSIPKWLMTVAHRESYKWFRQWKPPDDSATSAPPSIEPEPADEELLRLERRQIVHEALDRLGGRCRDLLTALFLDPSCPTYAQISARLDIPEGAIGPTRKRCLRKLLDLVEDRLE